MVVMAGWSFPPRRAAAAVSREAVTTDATGPASSPREEAENAAHRRAGAPVRAQRSASHPPADHLHADPDVPQRFEHDDDAERVRGDRARRRGEHDDERAGDEAESGEGELR